MMQPQPVTVAQQLTPREYFRLLGLLRKTATPIEATNHEPLYSNSSKMFHSVQVGEMVYFSFY